MTTAIDSVHDRAMQDLAAVIAALIQAGSLPGSSPVVPSGPQKVYVQNDQREESNISYPCVLVTCDGEAEEESEYSTFEEDGVIYPVVISIHDRQSQRNQAARPVYQSWRRTILRTLRGLVAAPILPNTTEAVDVRLRPQPVFTSESRKYQDMVSGFTAEVYTVEPRLRNDPVNGSST